MDINGNLFSKIKDSVYDAGKIMLEAREIRSTEVQKDGNENFVTRYDVAVQNKLHSDFIEMVPYAQFIEEESEQKDNKNKIDAKLCFIIDPIDGTSNFIAGYNHSAISVGICENGSISAGIVYDPYTDEMFYASSGSGAYLNGRRIHVSGNDLRESLVLFGTSPYYREELGEFSVEAMKKLFYASRDIRRSGSAAVDLCSVASGRADLFFEARLSPWDYAAGTVIISEAGGSVTDMYMNPVVFDRPCSILASNGVCTEKAFSCIESAGIHNMNL